MKKLNLLILVCMVAGIFYYFSQVRRPARAIRALNASASSSTPIGSPSGVLMRFQDELAKVAARTKPAVCNISASSVYELKQPQFFNNFFFFPFGQDYGYRQPRTEKFRQEATGSGVIIDQDGYILTNEHVIRGADEIKVTVYADGSSEGKVYPAEIVGKDAESDLAVIKIKKKGKYPYLKMGDSSSVKIAQLVFAIGSPFGLAQTVTMGIVSAERQSVQVENKIYDDMIQTDAAINRGNSGGPLIDMQGRVIGINTAIVAPSGGFIGVGFAIPINKAKPILTSLIEKGKVTRAWLGIEMKSVNSVIAKQFGVPSAEGALVNRVVTGSPAEKYGIKRGDIIIGCQGSDVKNPLGLKEEIRKYSPGTKVKLALIRDGRKMQVTVKLGTRENEVASSGKAENTEFSWKGISVKNITPDIRAKLNKGQQGVFVTGVDYSKDLGSSGIMAGDVITGINRNKINNLDDFRKVVKKTRISGGIVFDIVRKGMPLYITYVP